MSTIQSVGIIGLGNFGQLAASLAPEGVLVRGWDAHKTAASLAVKMTGLKSVVTSDVVLLAIPLEAYETVLLRIAPWLPADTLVVDVCSVKTAANKLLRKHLPNHQNVLVTHPLFGPQSASAGNTKGRELIVTRSVGARAESVVAYCTNKLELVVRRATNKEHDSAMAQIHALTFFVARGLAKAHVGQGVPFATPSFRLLLELIALDKTHTEALFRTIQTGNPYAKEARRHLLVSLQEIERELSNPMEML